MIISVSRRTDIPAFYSDWFFKRLAEGEVLVRNPFNRKQIKHISLNVDTVDCFVFWTRNCEPMLNRMHLLDEYKYYFQFTLTGYGKDIEPGFEDKSLIIQSFRRLSKMIGMDKVIWRYDPILINPVYDMAFHIKEFERLASLLNGYTNKCVISFIDNYRETKRNSKLLSLSEISELEMLDIGERFVKVANKYGIKIESCAEGCDLKQIGINHGSCVDPVLITNITGKEFIQKKEKLREHCGCIKSIDIGEYNSCPHRCAYCYANYNSGMIERNYKQHSIDSKTLISN